LSGTAAVQTRTQNSASSDALSAISDEILAALTKLAREIRFGSIEIVVHEGRITQIERREKWRVPPESQRG
jgi:hypothetical protein